jgi:hypothetical protein
MLAAPKTGAIQPATNTGLDRNILKIPSVPTLDMTTAAKVEVISRVPTTSGMMPLNIVPV